jgi:hypothetical protein
MAVLIDRIASSIQVAASCGNADLLQDGPKSIAELAAATQTHPDSLYRLLHALTSFGFFRRWIQTSLSKSAASCKHRSPSTFAWIVGASPGREWLD